MKSRIEKIKEDEARQRHEVQEFQEAQKKPILKASSIGAGSAFLCSIIVFWVLQFMGISTTTSLAIGLFALLAYLFRYVFYLLMLIERAILWTKDDMNNNHISVVDMTGLNLKK
jgi:Flp pilus assembly protein TadB